LSLIALADDSSEQAQLKRNTLKIEIHSKINAIFSQMNSVTAELDCEEERIDQIATTLSDINDKNVTRLTVASILVGAASAVAGAYIADDNWNKGVAVGSGVLGAGLSFLTLNPKGKKVLSTRGKDPDMNETYKTTTSPFDTGMPLAVLVNYATASSAEITSGSLQDYDRAVIVGQRTYGKGLVQSQRELPYNTMLKLTTAKYYIPSGRCVQAYDFKNRGADGQPKHLPDSLCKTFKTSNGRLVKDGGGITPDVAVTPDSLPDMLDDLALSEEFFDYVVKYLNTHRELAPAASFNISDADFQDFLSFMEKSSFTYNTQTKRMLDYLKKWADYEGYSDSIQTELKALSTKLAPNVAADLRRWQKEVRELLEYAIVSSHYGLQGAYAYKLRNDKELTLSTEILLDKDRYHKLLRK